MSLNKCWLKYINYQDVYRAGPPNWEKFIEFAEKENKAGADPSERFKQRVTLSNGM